SVDEFIELIITTHFGEYKNDYGFGFNIWEIEFENIQIEKFNTHNYPKQYLEKSLQSTIGKYEPRLRNVEVEILFIYTKIFKKKKIKYFVDITVKGELANNTSDKYSKSFQFAMGPFFK
ncbi:MAG: GPW/gp25 family protein, partial [Bacteroidales bacterium]|nr:GPW/gp25 family protein [Bacteroidales bacterium]